MFEKIEAVDDLATGKDKINRFFGKSYQAFGSALMATIVVNPSAGNNRTNTQTFSMQKGDTIQAYEDVSFSAQIMQNGTPVSAQSGWYKTFTATEDGMYSLRLKLDDDSTLRDKEAYLELNLKLSGSNSLITRQEFDEVAQAYGYTKVDDVNIAIDTYGTETITLECGYARPGIYDSLACPSLEATARVNLKTGDFIKLTDTENYELAIIIGDAAYVDGWNSTQFTALETGEYTFRVRRKDGTTVNAPSLNILVKETGKKLVTHEQLIASSGGEVTKYVSLNGNDNNSGNNMSDAYATVQKALDEGATTIHMQRGVYRQTLSINGAINKLSILPFDDKSYTLGDYKNQKIVLMGAERLTNLVESNGVYSQELTAKPKYKEYFIDKSIEQMTTSTRPQYNAILWESKDGEIDYAMKPVQSLQEVQAEVGTFYWDGTKIFINPQDITNEFYAPDIDRGLNFTGVRELHLDSIVADYFLSEPFILTSVKSINLFECEANHAAYTDGFSFNYANGKFELCSATKNRNDGFNSHYYGDVIMTNCKGINNYDDGASPHEGASMTVIGGEYRGNGKGGISPATGGRAYIYNAVLQNNRYGLYNSNAGANNISSGNLYIENECAIYNTGSQGLKSINDKLSNNEMDSSGSDYEKY